jgi:hypothetical protein
MLHENASNHAKSAVSVSQGRDFRDVGRVPRTLARRQQGSLDASRAESGGLIISITPDFALFHLGISC